MLIEISSDTFRTRKVEFHSGLNVILGDENATNSIGKSTLLMVIDFAFGGGTLLDHNKDLVTELGHHDYLFAFKFDETVYRFRRGTNQPEVVYVQGDDDSSAPITLDDYRALLKASYKITADAISFRALVGLYFRVWGKENLNVYKPLHIVQSQSAKECVNSLIKTYQRYGSIEKLSEELWRKEGEKGALMNAFKHQIVPKIGKRAHGENIQRIDQIEKDIEDIKNNLAQYATNISEIVNREILEQKVQKDQLLATRLNLQSKLARIEKNLSNNRYIKSKHFASLIKFFPEIDKERLVNVEEFHSKLAVLLRSELRDTEKQLEEQIAIVNSEISKIDSMMRATLSSIDEPTVIVDRVYELSTSLNKAQSENEHYESLIAIKDEIATCRERLTQEKGKVLAFIQNVVNDGLRRIVTSVFGEDRKSPQIVLGENNYTYKVFEDTGTGTAYTALIVFDLTIFSTTSLPFVAHDTVLFKNIENDSVARLFELYIRLGKQSFVAIDEIGKYGDKIAALLEANSVIKLSNSAVLYIKDWRK